MKEFLGIWLLVCAGVRLQLLLQQQQQRLKHRIGLVVGFFSLRHGGSDERAANTFSQSKYVLNAEIFLLRELM